MSMAMPGTVQSVVRCQDNGALIAAVAQLWIHEADLVVDVTYGRGLFWTKCRPCHLAVHDLALDGVDFRQLPEADRSVDVVVFDPPYIPQGGRTTSGLPDFLDRYGLFDVPSTHGELDNLIAAGIEEAARVLKPRGRLLVKCMDYVHGGRFRTGRHNVVAAAIAAGLEQVDEFIHYSGCGPQPTENIDGTPRAQLHSRRAHTFLCVFQAKPVRMHSRDLANG